VHEADEPDTVVNFLDADCLPSQAGTEINLLAIQTKASTVGDDDGLIVERIVRFADATIRLGERRVDFRWAFHGECFMRPFVVKFF
jgi:hypothetical protein